MVKQFVIQMIHVFVDEILWCWDGQIIDNEF